jgi:hypothetical protein
VSPRRQRFVNAYVGEAAGNGAKAAILAGYSEHTARQAASRLLTFPDVRQAIDARQQAATHQAGVQAEDIRRELKAVAYAPVKDVRTTDKLKALELLGKEQGMFQDKRDAGSGITVNIGFLTNTPDRATVQVMPQVMPPQPRVAPRIALAGDVGCASPGAGSD